MRIACAGLLGLALLLGACQGVKVQPPRILAVAVEPAVVEVGHRVTVTASAVDKAEMAYISGTVGVSGMPVVPLKLDSARGYWYLTYTLPVFWTIPAGKYEIKAWGESREGLKYEGTTFVEVK